MGGLIPFVPGRIRGLAMRYSRKARRSVGVEKEAKDKGRAFLAQSSCPFGFESHRLCRWRCPAKKRSLWAPSDMSC